MNGDFEWTADRVEFLKARQAEKISAANIAVEMRIRFDLPLSRSAVLGKLNRLGIKGKRGGVQPGSGRPRKPRGLTPQIARIVRGPPTQPAPAPAAEPPRTPPIGILELTNETCRFPIGEPVAGFCGQTTADLANGRPYCGWHARMAYRRPGEREEAA